MYISKDNKLLVEVDSINSLQVKLNILNTKSPHKLWFEIDCFFSKFDACLCAGMKARLLGTVSTNDVRSLMLMTAD